MQQPAGLCHEGCCSVPILRRWSTWRSDVGITWPAQWGGGESMRFHGPKLMRCMIMWKLAEVEPEWGVETVKNEVLMVVLVLGLEVLMNHIGIYDEDTMGSSVGSFDGMTYEKNLWVHCKKFLWRKGWMWRWRDQDVVHEAEESMKGQF